MPERILVVDDEQKIVHLCIQILEKEGYEAKGIYSSQGAIDIVRKERFDLLLRSINKNSTII